MKRLFVLLLAGCAASQPPPPPPVQPPPPPPKAAAYAGAAVVDPKTIVGYVKGVANPEPIHDDRPRHEGEITALESKPEGDYINKLRFNVEGIGNFLVLVPRTLPLPFAVGDRVWIRSRDYGGGPNHRVTITMKASDGSLMFALDEPPDGWKVEEGKRVESRNEGDYTAHHHEVIFETEGNKLTTKPGKWARFDVGEKSYYVWGVSVTRKRHSQGRPPLDYVGGWLDFAIVRAR